MDHNDSSGQPCEGCPDTCEQAKVPHVPAGLLSAVTGCCAMRFGHGAYTFDDDGNILTEAVCCAEKECDSDRGCDAHSPDESKGHVVEVKAHFDGGRFPEVKAQAIAAKVARTSKRDNGAPTADRVADAGLTFDLDAKQVTARVTTLEKRVVNGREEWHHVAPSDDEVRAIRAALKGK